MGHMYYEKIPDMMENKFCLNLPNFYYHFLQNTHLVTHPPIPSYFQLFKSTSEGIHSQIVKNHQQLLLSVVTVVERRAFNCICTFGNNSKSLGAKSGEKLDDKQ